jgi:hypothetical protein
MTPRVFVYFCDDPACPPAARAVAHWFDAKGRLQVATATDAEPEIARQRLTGFLHVEIARANVRNRERTPDEVAAAKARTAKATAARLARARR